MILRLASYEIIHSSEIYFRCVVSGCGKIAMHVVEKLIACGAHPVTVSGDPVILSFQIQSNSSV